jgi:hypothetical protein
VIAETLAFTMLLVPLHPEPAPAPPAPAPAPIDVAPHPEPAPIQGAPIPIPLPPGALSPSQPPGPQAPAPPMHHRPEPPADTPPDNPPPQDPCFIILFTSVILRNRCHCNHLATHNRLICLRAAVLRKHHVVSHRKAEPWGWEQRPRVAQEIDDDELTRSRCSGGV